mmetsp:Transcript_72485/g.235453  ORF Transcript_72485/g.235453 Transcript_72485/m.235453 type:complete len:346 (+) Transcript_72485:595-1632(+)
MLGGLHLLVYLLQAGVHASRAREPLSCVATRDGDLVQCTTPHRGAGQTLQRVLTSAVRVSRPQAEAVDFRAAVVRHALLAIVVEAVHALATVGEVPTFDGLIGPVLRIRRPRFELRDVAMKVDADAVGAASVTAAEHFGGRGLTAHDLAIVAPPSWVSALAIAVVATDQVHADTHCAATVFQAGTIVDILAPKVLGPLQALRAHHLLRALPARAVAPCAYHLVARSARQLVGGSHLSRTFPTAMVTIDVWAEPGFFLRGRPVRLLSALLFALRALRRLLILSVFVRHRDRLFIGSVLLMGIREASRPSWAGQQIARPAERQEPQPWAASRHHGSWGGGAEVRKLP